MGIIIKKKIDIETKDDLIKCITFLNNLGSILYFNNINSINNKVFIDPIFIIDIFKLCLINSLNISIINIGSIKTLLLIEFILLKYNIEPKLFKNVIHFIKSSFVSISIFFFIIIPM